jgi:hypothetical protein
MSKCPQCNKKPKKATWHTVDETQDGAQQETESLAAKCEQACAADTDIESTEESFSHSTVNRMEFDGNDDQGTEHSNQKSIWTNSKSKFESQDLVSNFPKHESVILRDFQSASKPACTVKDEMNLPGFRENVISDEFEVRRNCPKEKYSLEVNLSLISQDDCTTTTVETEVGNRLMATLAQDSDRLKQPMCGETGQDTPVGAVEVPKIDLFCNGNDHLRPPGQHSLVSHAVDVLGANFMPHVEAKPTVQLMTTPVSDGEKNCHFWPWKG